MASSVPSAPKPKPSAAPTEVEVVDINLPQATQAAEEVTSPSPLYSPVTVESSSTDSSSSDIESPSPDLRKMPVDEAWEILKICEAQDIQMSPRKSDAFWRADSLYGITKLMCPTWQSKVIENAIIHHLSHPPSEGADAESGRVRVWVHSSISSLNQMLASGDLGCRYTFVSAIQCAMHRVAHSHFGLSAAVLKPDTILLELEIAEDWLINHGQLAVNGFTESVSVPKLPLTEANIVLAGAVHLSPALNAWLQGEEGAKLTQRSISQFESFAEAASMSQYKLVTQETVQALLMPMPHSGKVRATLEAQCPDVFSSWEKVINSAKAEWIKQYEQEKSKSTGESSSTGVTTIQVTVGSEDEITLAVTKKAKHG
eukprot:447407-Amphidinium_carterae.1